MRSWVISRLHKEHRSLTQAQKGISQRKVLWPLAAAQDQLWVDLYCQSVVPKSYLPGPCLHDSALVWVRVNFLLFSFPLLVNPFGFYISE